MKKFTKTHLDQRDAFAKALRERYDDLSTLVEQYNTTMQTLWDEIATAQDAFNQAIVDARDWLEGVEGEMEKYYNDRSERWQEGDAGQAYQEWMQSVNDCDLTEADLSAPTDLDEPEGADAADNLENLEPEPAS